MRNGPRTADLPMDTLYTGDPFPDQRQDFAYTNTAYDTSYEQPRMFPNTTDEYYPERYSEVQDEYQSNKTRRPSKLPNSTWWKWSQERRAALARRESQSNKLKTNVRVPTPIIKAREESIKFVAPELKDQHLPEDHKRQKTKKKVVKGKKGKKSKVKNPRTVDSEKDLTLEQWNELIEYWDHHTFTYARCSALILGILGLAAAVFIIVSDDWVQYSDRTEYAGLWRRCGIKCNSTLETNNAEKGWHQAVFSLMIATVAIGLTGIIVLIFGLCITYLPQKIYYYHSSAEIFIVCAFLELCALITYPVGISKANAESKFMFNYCYFIGWADFLMFCGASMCLLFDELLRESSKPREVLSPCCFGRKKSNKKKTDNHAV